MDTPKINKRLFSQKQILTGLLSSWLFLAIAIYYSDSLVQYSVALALFLGFIGTVLFIIIPAFIAHFLGGKSWKKHLLTSSICYLLFWNIGYIAEGQTASYGFILLKTLQYCALYLTYFLPALAIRYFTTRTSKIVSAEQDAAPNR